MTALCNIYV